MQHKYFLLIVLAFLLNCQIGSALECYDCFGKCDDKSKMKKVTCQSDNPQCMSVSYKEANIDVTLKSCSDKEMCKQNYAVSAILSVKPKCCGTNLCNSAISNVMSLGTAVFLALVSFYISQF